jgi:hypothetical protein
MMSARHAVIVQRLLARLEGIQAGGFSGIPNAVAYNLTPNRVVRVIAFDDQPFDRSLGKVVYFVWAPTHTFSEESNQTLAGVVDAAIVVAAQDDGATGNPFFEETPSRADLVDQMIEDVTNALFADVTLGGLANNVVDEQGLVWDRARFMPGWALAEAALKIQFSVINGQV